MTFNGAKIRVYRESAGLSVRKLAKMAGISPAALSQLENGNVADPGVNTLHYIASALGVASIYIFFDAPVLNSIQHAEGVQKNA